MYVKQFDNLFLSIEIGIVWPVSNFSAKFLNSGQLVIGYRFLGNMLCKLSLSVDLLTFSLDDPSVNSF
jgi:hypothetical protein